MEVSPEQFRRIIPPPPVVLVSTLHGDVRNVAPFGMNMPISSNPPLYAIGVRATRDTFQNIVDAEEFVVGVPGPDLIRQIDLAAKPFPRDVSEFEKAGLTPVKSKIVKSSRIKECQSNLECKLEWIKQAGDHYIVVGRVVAADIVDRFYSKDLSRMALDPVYYAQTGIYAAKGQILNEPS